MKYFEDCTSPFLVLSALNTSKEKSIAFVWILFSLTSCSSIPVWVHPESTRAFTFNFFPFFVLMFACTFNFLFPPLALQFGIIYFLEEFICLISHTMPTQDCLQNPAPCRSCLLCLILLLVSCVSSSFAFLCNPWRYVLSFCI